MKPQFLLYQLQSVSPFIKKESRWAMQCKKKKFLNNEKTCFHCGRILSLQLAKNGEKQKEDTATVDHIYSTLDIKRILPTGDKTVLCCYACNQIRASQDLKRLYKGFDYNTPAFTVNLKNKSIILSPELFKTA